MADKSSSIIKALFSNNESTRDLSEEEIDAIILRILGLDDVFDIDYDTYISLLKEKLLESFIGKGKIPREEEVLIQEEYKRVKSKKGKGRFKPKKKITADSFRKGSAVGINLNQKLIGPGLRPALPPSIDKMSGTSDIKDIIDALGSIIEQLTILNSLQRNEADRERRNRESDRRRRREEGLEKRFDGVRKAAEKVIAPVKSILQRIIDFLLAILVGRSLILLLDWLSNKENQDKVRAIGRFLGDHWPKLLALYIAFGTSLGRFARGLIKLVIRGTGQLIKGALWIGRKIGIKGAAGALGFLGGPRGKLIGAGLEIGATALGTLALSKGIENFGGIGGSKEEQTPTANFAGGGFANFKNFFSGLVSGPKGVDKVPAMLTDGEFVMSKGAVQKYGLDTLESMNAAGGGTNTPKIVQGTTYAAGGGSIGIAADHLKKDEALSSLTKGDNDFIRPNRRSVSGKPWSSIKPNTKIHTYLDSVNQPTIGWGSTFYDSILNGKKPVKPGDTVTKSQADGILFTNIKNLYNKYKTEIPTWNKMSSQQQAGILSLGYNAPYAPIGAYPKLTQALKSGDMLSAANNIHRKGPSAKRLEMERKLILTGPKNLNAPSKKVKSGIPFMPSFLYKPQLKSSTMGNEDNVIPAMNGASISMNGKVLENTGVKRNTSGADRRLVTMAVQPGENIKVFTKKFVDKGGMPIVEYLQSLMDSNSKDYRSGKTNTSSVHKEPAYNAKISSNRPSIKTPSPPSRPLVKVSYANPRKSNAVKNNPTSSRPKVPNFSAASSTRSRVRVAATYGIG